LRHGPSADRGLPCRADNREWLQEWWTTTTNLRRTTAVRDETYLRLYVLPRFGDLPLAAIGQRDVRAWVADLTARGLAPATVVKAYHLLGKVLAGAVDAGMIAQSPCRRVSLPKIEREEMRFLTPVEIGRLTDAIRPPTAPWSWSAPTAGSASVSSPAYDASASTCCAAPSKSPRS
jgi:site-specific recombinase XerD